jgi:Rhamnan synthesis protein F
MKTLFTALTQGAQNARTKYCVFSHFDARPRVERYVLHYLRHLKACGYEIVLVSTAPGLSDEAVNELKPVCNTVCLRENVGYDFGSFKAGITLLKQHGAKVDRLLVANDSVFGPFNDMQPLLRSMEREDIDLYGLTDSHDHGYHLQSYFISYSARVYESPVFDSFWSSVDMISSSTDNFKQKIVHNYEVGGSQHFLDAGCTYAVAFPYCDVLDRLFQRVLDRLNASRDSRTQIQVKAEELFFNLNASHRYWDELIDMGLPFIKRELLTRNPTGADLTAWPEKIASVSAYDVAEILEALIHQGAVEQVYPIDTAEALAQIDTPVDSFEVPIKPSLAQWINGSTVKATARFQFDDEFYLRSYPDIAAVVQSGDYPFGLRHFKRYGFPEGRKCAFKLAQAA